MHLALAYFPPSWGGGAAFLWRSEAQPYQHTSHSNLFMTKRFECEVYSR